jgi:tetratricopeptide (TPR) repeat protein
MAQHLKASATILARNHIQFGFMQVSSVFRQKALGRGQAGCSTECSIEAWLGQGMVAPRCCLHPWRNTSKYLQLSSARNHIRFDLCRSAAYAAKGLWEEARQDAAQSAALKPGWAKAWSRLGAAYMGLQAWSEAKDTYGRAMVLEPDDKTVQTAWAKVLFRTLIA